MPAARDEAGALPDAGGHADLRDFAAGERVSDPHDPRGAAGTAELHVFDGVAGVKMPDLVRVDAVQRGEIPAGEQKINRRGRGPAAAAGRRGDPEAAEKTAFVRQGPQPERGDEAAGRGVQSPPPLRRRSCSCCGETPLGKNGAIFSTTGVRNLGSARS